MPNNLDDNQVLQELKKINERLDTLSQKNRFFVFSTNPARFAFYNFMAGLFHSLGSLFTTAILAAVLIYLFSLIDLPGLFSDFFNTVFSNIDFDKLIPQQPLLFSQ